MCLTFRFLRGQNNLQLSVSPFQPSTASLPLDNPHPFARAASPVPHVARILQAINMIQRRYQRILLLTVVGWVVLYFGFDFSDRFNRQLRIHVDDVPARAPKSDAIKAEEKELVVASLMRDRVKWLNESFPTWKRNVYVVDKRDAELTVPKNKGREAMVFLT